MVEGGIWRAPIGPKGSRQLPWERGGGTWPPFGLEGAQGISMEPCGPPPSRDPFGVGCTWTMLIDTFGILYSHGFLFGLGGIWGTPPDLCKIPTPWCPFWAGRHLGNQLSSLWDFHSDGVLFAMQGTEGSTFRGAHRESYGVPETPSGVGDI